MKKTFQALGKALLAAEHFVSIVCCIAIVVLVFVSVVMRYIFKSSFQGMEELIMRIEAILRRTSGESPVLDVYKLGRFRFDTQKQQLIDGDNIIKLTTKESELLKLLCTNANKVLERQVALKTIWVDDNYFNARSMDVYITKLRKHLKDDPTVEIINVHGKGYKLVM